MTDEQMPSPPSPPTAGAHGPTWPPPSDWWTPPPGWGPGPYQSGGPGRRRRLPALVAAMLIVVAALGGVGIGHAVWTQPTAVNGSGGNPNSNPFGTVLPGGGFSNPGGGANVPEGAGGPSHVSSIAAKVDPDLVDIADTFEYQGAEGFATGIVVTSKGEVLTNNHVINGETNKISVTDVGNGRTYNATVVGYDASKDVAVLQLQGASGLKAARIDTSTPSVGAPVVAIGNAGGAGGTPTASGGSITALHQAISAGDDLDGTSEQLADLIQVDADVQSGDSGGSLVNSSGQVIGMDTASSAQFAFSGASGQGYAIPIGEALRVAHQIETGHGSSTVHVGETGFIGLLVSSAGPEQGNFGFGSGGGSLGGGGGTSAPGAYVSGVVNRSPAEQAGIAAGDTITSFANQKIATPSALTEELVPCHPGQTVEVGWTDSSGHTHRTTLTLANGPPA